jgi:hypothetical protein
MHTIETGTWETPRIRNRELLLTHLRDHGLVHVRHLTVGAHRHIRGMVKSAIKWIMLACVECWIRMIVGRQSVVYNSIVIGIRRLWTRILPTRSGGPRGSVILVVRRIIALFDLFLRSSATLLMRSGVLARQTIVRTMGTRALAVALRAQLVALVAGSTYATSHRTSVVGVIVDLGFPSLAPCLEIVVVVFLLGLEHRR